MSFSAEVKQELCRAKIPSKIEALLELSGIARMCAAVRFNHRGTQLVFSTENGEVADRIVRLVKRLYEVEPVVRTRKSGSLRRHPICEVALDAGVTAQFFTESAMDEFGNFTVPRQILLGRLKIEKNAAAYLRGTFLGGGAIVDPRKSYQLEILFTREEDVWLLLALLKEASIRMRRTRRGEHNVLYSKDSEQISDFLVRIGAVESMLHLADSKAMKDLRNEVNRKVNADTANINRSVESGIRQAEAILFLLEHGNPQEWSAGLRAVADARVAEPEISLKELGARLHPPISKSGVNHRMQRLMKMAAALRQNGDLQ